MATDGQMTMDAPVVEVIFCPDSPQHYVARFGRDGWSEAWGWSETEALRNLARALADAHPDDVPISRQFAARGMIAWLRSGYDVPIVETHAVGQEITATDDQAL